MTEKEIIKFKKEAVEWHLARCLEMKLVSFKTKKELNALCSLFNSAISLSFEKGQLSAYKDSKKTFKDKFLKNFGVRI